MALILAENDYTPDELSEYLKNTSTLTSNNRGLVTEIDNSIGQGSSADKNSSSFRPTSDFNIVYTNPSNNQQWITFQGINHASSSSIPHPLFIILATTLHVFLFLRSGTNTTL